MQRKRKRLVFLANLAISLGTGIVSGALVDSSLYETIRLPAGAPPAALFPVVWTVLYALMGISAALIVLSDSRNKTKALIAYGRQLFVNFLWPALFFNAQMFGFALLWLLLLIGLVINMIIMFHKISPIAAKLQIPYLVWLLYAAYLNLGVFLLNW